MIQDKCIQHNEPLNFICLDFQYQKQSLLCICCYDKTKHQNSITIPAFLSRFSQSQSIERSILNCCAVIDQIANKIGQLITKLFVEDTSRMKKIYHQFIVKLKKQILRTKIELARPSLMKSTKELQQWIKSNFQLCFIEGKQGNLMLAYLENNVDFLQKLEKCVQEMINTKNNQERQLIGWLNGQRLVRRKIYFTPNLTPKNLEIMSQRKIRVKEVSSQRIAVLEPNLSGTIIIDLGFGKQKWKVKIQKLTSWIGVGVVHLTKIVKGDFYFNYTTPAHGNYFLSSNGYFWNGYQMQKNSKAEGSSFITGDIIELEYDPHEHTISFRKQGQGKTHILFVDPNENPIHAAVNLTSIGDEVEIIQ